MKVFYHDIVQALVNKILFKTVKIFFNLKYRSSTVFLFQLNLIQHIFVYFFFIYLFNIGRDQAYRKLIAFQANG